MTSIVIYLLYRIVIYLLYRIVIYLLYRIVCYINIFYDTSCIMLDTDLGNINNNLMNFSTTLWKGSELHFSTRRPCSQHGSLYLLVRDGNGAVLTLTKANRPTPQSGPEDAIQVPVRIRKETTPKVQESKMYS